VTERQVQRQKADFERHAKMPVASTRYSDSHNGDARATLMPATLTCAGGDVDMNMDVNVDMDVNMDVDIDRRVLAGRCYQARRDGVEGDGLGRCHALVPVTGIRGSDDRNSDVWTAVTPSTINTVASWVEGAILKGCGGRDEKKGRKKKSQCKKSKKKIAMHWHVPCLRGMGG
jgi:hypothetical protein